jgi:hypothetical protein
VTKPRIALVPPAKKSLGKKAVELAASAGLKLDPWQQDALKASLGLMPDGRWASFEVGLNVARQNGKGAILEARELAGLFLLDEKLLIHTAHEFKTSSEHFRRLQALIHDTPDLHAKVKRNNAGRAVGYRLSHGEESIELSSGARILFATRTKSAGRGFAAADFIAFDEAMFISEAMVGALIPIMAARSLPEAGGTGPQVWYTGSAVDQMVHDTGIVFARVRERGLSGEDKRLCYLEYSVDAEHPELVTEVTEAMIKQANPALGLRISLEYVEEQERRTLSNRTFATERLGVGDWPATDGGEGGPIDIDEWLALHDELSEMVDPVCMAVDVSPDRRGSISAASRRPDGLIHVETVDNKAGTSWLPSRLNELVDRHQPAVVLMDGYGPAASVLTQIEEAGVTITTVSAAENAQACGRLLDLVKEGRLRHRVDEYLENAIRAAKTRPLGDAWAWSRKNSSEDISPLVAGTLAVKAADDEPELGTLEIY